MVLSGECNPIARKLKAMLPIARATIALLCLNLFLSSARAAEDWKQEWEKTVQAARREGELTIYGPHNPMYRPLWELFQKSFPGVKINFEPGKGGAPKKKVPAGAPRGKSPPPPLEGGFFGFLCLPRRPARAAAAAARSA